MASPERLTAPAADPKDAAAELLAFCAQEISGFFGYLSGAVQGYKENKPLPDGRYKAHSKPGPKPGPRRGSDSKPRAHRAPTAYNIFVQRKAAELKAAGVDHDGSKGAFQIAAAEWSKLSKAEKDKFTQAHKADLAANPSAQAAVLPEAAQVPQPDAPTPATDAAGSGDEKKKKKKKKHRDSEAAAPTASDLAPSQAANVPSPVPATAEEGARKKKKKSKLSQAENSSQP